MFVDITQQCFALLPQINSPPIIWIFTEGEGHGIKFRLPFKFFSTLLSNVNTVPMDSLCIRSRKGAYFYRQLSNQYIFFAFCGVVFLTPFNIGALGIKSNRFGKYIAVINPQLFFESLSKKLRLISLKYWFSSTGIVNNWYILSGPILSTKCFQNQRN